MCIVTTNAKEGNQTVIEKILVPVAYREGIYKLEEVKVAVGEADDALVLKHYEPGNYIVVCVVVNNNARELKLYNIPREELDSDLRLTYDARGCLRRISLDKAFDSRLIYISYQNIEEARRIIDSFAKENSRAILEQLRRCREKVKRLFIESFNGEECMDFHVKIGTEAENRAIRKKYKRNGGMGDNSELYSSENLHGDNERFQVLVTGAEDELFDYAVEKMTEYIIKEAKYVVSVTRDYRVICQKNN